MSGKNNFAVVFPKQGNRVDDDDDDNDDDDDKFNIQSYLSDRGSDDHTCDDFCFIAHTLCLTTAVSTFFIILSRRALYVFSWLLSF